MNLAVVLLICVTVLVCVSMITSANINITITHNGTGSNTTVPEMADIQQVYDAIEKNKEQPPSFTDVIKVINEEFGGVDYGEK